MSSDPPALPEVLLYGAPGCTLCTEAADGLLILRQQEEFEFRELNVRDDPELERRYAFEIPVVTIDGDVVCRGRFERAAVRAALLRARRGQAGGSR